MVGPQAQVPANPQLGTLLAVARVLQVDPAQLIADMLRDAGVVIEYDPGEHDIKDGPEPD